IITLPVSQPGTGGAIPLNDTVMIALEAHAAWYIRPESTVDTNVYVIIEKCSTFGNTSKPLDEAPSRSGCAHSTFTLRRKQRRRLSGLRMVTFPTSRLLVTAFSNTRLILVGQRRIEKTTGTGRPRKNTMALTKDFRETIRERAQQEPKFRKALLREAIELMLSGDEKTGRAILRNYINATIGFRQLEEATSIPANSLMRMFGPNGNPSAKNLFGVLAHLQAQEGVNFEIRPRRG